MDGPGWKRDAFSPLCWSLGRWRRCFQFCLTKLFPLCFGCEQAEPSPTTGTFPLPPFLAEPPKDKNNDQGSTPGFVFKPFPVSAMRNPMSPLSQGLVSSTLSNRFRNLFPCLQFGRGETSCLARILDRAGSNVGFLRQLRFVFSR